jgi:hypothetical protein
LALIESVAVKTIEFAEIATIPPAPPPPPPPLYPPLLLEDPPPAPDPLLLNNPVTLNTFIAFNCMGNFGVIIVGFATVEVPPDPPV